MCQGPHSYVPLILSFQSSTSNSNSVRYEHPSLSKCNSSSSGRSSLDYSLILLAKEVRML
jgi:hypothetical protein